MTDTSKEAVERLVQDLDANSVSHFSGYPQARRITASQLSEAASTLRALLAERDEAVTIGQVMAQRAGELKVERDAIAAAACGALSECFNMWQDECWVGQPQGVSVEVVGFFRPYYDSKLRNTGALADKFPTASSDALAHLKAMEAKDEARGMREAAELAKHGHHPRAILSVADEREKGSAP